MKVNLSSSWLCTLIGEWWIIFQKGPFSSTWFPGCIFRWPLPRCDLLDVVIFMFQLWMLCVDVLTIFHLLYALYRLHLGEKYILTDVHTDTAWFWLTLTRVKKKVQTNNKTVDNHKACCVDYWGGSAASRWARNILRLRISFESFETFRLENEVNSFI